LDAILAPSPAAVHGCPSAMARDFPWPVAWWKQQVVPARRDALPLCSVLQRLGAPPKVLCPLEQLASLLLAVPPVPPDESESLLAWPPLAQPAPPVSPLVELL
jgi:hypothetical protein